MQRSGLTPMLGLVMTHARFPQGSGLKHRKTGIATRKRIAANICLAQERAKFSGNQVARDLDVDRSQLTKWRNGSSVPTFDRLAQLAEAFGVTPGWFLDNDPNAAAPVDLKLAA